ncbi:MAG: hypothetical protein HXY38_10095 [Chloroflexi bacterium]|nr:hypothetical protein [Chloroflexota bacterium]
MNRTIILIPLLLFQTGCTAATPEMTSTPTQTTTPPPASPPTPTPVTPTPTAALPKALTLEADGFSLSVPLVLSYEIKNNVVGVFDQEGTFIASFIRTDYNEPANSLQDALNEYLSQVADRGGEFVNSEPYPLVLDGVEGIAVDLAGDLLGSPVEGRAIAVYPEEKAVFIGLGISNLTTDKEQWNTTGAQYFEMLTTSVRFVETRNNETCPVSQDKTYGYAEDNPIKVGGGFLDGPARERSYFDNLLGPNGEALTYERMGSIPSGDTILDQYRITGQGVDATLYLDEYNYAPLQAPIGFTCIGEFPLSAP